MSTPGALLLSSFSWGEPMRPGLLAQRTVVFWFCFSVMGQIWVWSWILLRLRGLVAWTFLALYLAWIWYGPGARASKGAGPWPKLLQQ